MIHHKVEKKSVCPKKTFFLYLFYLNTLHISALRTFQTKSNKLFYIFFLLQILFFHQHFVQSSTFCSVKREKEEKKVVNT